MTSPRRLLTARRLAILLLGAVAAWWLAMPPPAPWLEETYARRVYPALAAVLVPLGDLVPFSLSVTAIVFALVCVPAGLVQSWRAGRKQGRPLLHTGGRWLEATVLWSLIAYVLFIGLWGAGYRRERLEARLGLGAEAVTSEDVDRWVAAVCRRIGETSIETLERDARRALDSLSDSLRGVLREWDGIERTIPRRVKLLPPGAFLAFGSAGVTSPYFLEAHIDSGQPEVGGLWTAAHELAHIGGLCPEADADLAAAVAGWRAADPYARYATSLRLFQAFAGALPEEGYRAARASLPAEAQADLQQIEGATQKLRVEFLARAQHAVYDRYLRAQGVKEGVKEYSFLVRTLVRAERRGVIRLEHQP